MPPKGMGGSERKHWKPERSPNPSRSFPGEMAEWSKAPDSKSGVPKGTVGSTPTLSSTIMETLKGFPNPPALWRRRAKPASANAEGWEPSGSQTLPRSGDGGQSPPPPTRKDGNPQVPKPSRALATAGKARFRQRGRMGTLKGFPCPPHANKKAEYSTSERWPSGRRRMIGNHVYRKVPRVRIPLSPPQ